MTSQATQDRIISTVLTLVSGGGATLVQPALWPFTLTAVIIMLLIVKFSGDQLLRATKWVLVAVTLVIALLVTITIVGIWALWRLLS